MIANLLNTILGLALVYLAVLVPIWGTNPIVILIGGVLVLLLAWWARASDYRRWQSSVNLVLGVLLLVLDLFDWIGLASPLSLFWGVFWPGILVALFALWALLYRPGVITPADAAAGRVA